jgi:hypothetical protein
MPKHWVYLASTPDVSSYYITDDQATGIGDTVCLTGSRGAPGGGPAAAPSRCCGPAASTWCWPRTSAATSGTAAGRSSLDTSPMASSPAAASNASL